MADRIGYRIVEPAGWVRLAADEIDRTSVHELAVRIASTSAQEVRAGVQKFVESQLTEALTLAKSNGGMDLLLPVELVDGAPLLMTVVVGSVALAEFTAEGGQSDALLGYAGRHTGSEASEVDGSLAVRTVVDVDALPDSADPDRLVDTRRVAYLIAAPTLDKRLMIVTCSMKRDSGGSDSRTVEAMELLFDALVSTIRLPTEEGAV